jgi:putative acetyltransferase
MDFRILDRTNEKEVKELFTTAFANSDGEEEGRLVGGLASQLAARADNQEIICIGAFHEETISGVIFFTRLRFDEPAEVYMLAPVAVSIVHQGKGVGQALIKFGLQELRNRSASIVVTYGDLAFYSKLGFRALSEDTLRAPLTLSIPEGWLGQSLTGEPISKLKSRPVCVPEFDNPEYW